MKHDAKAATCTEIGWDAYNTCKNCDYTTYKQIDATGHSLVKHNAQTPTCTDIGWDAYETCKNCDYTTYKQIDATGHSLVKHNAQTPTCTDIGWNAYETCKNCDYTTRVDIDALDHDLVISAAKAPTCTEKGWNDYVCQREGCDYTTRVDVPALNHDIIKHDAKAPTCTEIGWDAYKTCKNCDYTTYKELAALDHDYAIRTVKPTCTEDGYTLHTCTRCGDKFTDNRVEKLWHWFGEWTPNAESTENIHSALCLRGCGYTGETLCTPVEFLLTAEGEDAPFSLTLCPVCGEYATGARIALIENAAAAPASKDVVLPTGELVLRMGALENGDTIMSVAFEYDGRLVQPTGAISFTLPAELLEGCTLSLVNADGTVAPLTVEIDGESASFTLDFTDAETPALLIRLVPAA